MMGRYSLDKPGLIYAHSGNEGFDPSQYQTFPADADGIIPLTETDWFIDDAANRFVEFISVAWPKEHLEENLKFLADNLGPNKRRASPRHDPPLPGHGFYKDHLQTYKKRPIYWLFSSGKQRAFQCLVYLHRYNEGTLARMRTEYVIPLQGKMAARIEQLDGDIAAASPRRTAANCRRSRTSLNKQRPNSPPSTRNCATTPTSASALDLDDGVKVNYGKFGDLLAEVKAVTGGRTT